MQENKPVLIVGLGNPGTRYIGTRHNVGFVAVEHLAGADATWRREKNALVAKLPNNVILAKPQTFMNLSGNSVRELMKFYKIPLENLIVIHDDMDLPVGTTRDKIGGGSAGHNGIKSMDENVGRDYMRIRIGVGRPPEHIDPADWVLGKFSPGDESAIKKVIDELTV